MRSVSGSWRAHSSSSRCCRRSSSRSAGRSFRGGGLGWFIVGTLVFFVATLSAVELFAAEPAEETADGETDTNDLDGDDDCNEAAAEPAARRATERQGRLLGPGLRQLPHVQGRRIERARSGPDLDTALQGKDAAFVHQSIVDPNKVIASGYQPNIMPQNFGQTLTPTQINDLVAFLTQSG